MHWCSPKWSSYEQNQRPICHFVIKCVQQPGPCTATRPVARTQIRGKIWDNIKKNILQKINKKINQKEHLSYCKHFTSRTIKTAPQKLIRKDLWPKWLCYYYITPSFKYHKYGKYKLNTFPNELKKLPSFTNCKSVNF